MFFSITGAIKLLFHKLNKDGVCDSEGVSVEDLHGKTLQQKYPQMLLIPTLPCSDMLEMNLHNSDSANQGGGDYSADKKWTFAIKIK